jgi:surfeit locus 1 family protein
MLFIRQHYVFRPTGFMTILTIFSLLLFSNLGMWQIHRGHAKALLLSQYDMRRHASPVNFSMAMANQDILYRHVQAHGYFDNKHNFLLDNRFHDHQIGYEVITPFLPLNEKTFLLINRGWIAAPISRKNLPLIPDVSDVQTVTGIMNVVKPFSLFKVDEESAQWPRRIPYFDSKLLAKDLNQKVFPGLLLLDPHASNGFVRDWSIVIMPPAKHYAYAVQWFLFALIALSLYVCLNLKPKKEVFNES